MVNYLMIPNFLAIPDMKIHDPLLLKIFSTTVLLKMPEVPEIF